MEIQILYHLQDHIMLEVLMITEHGKRINLAQVQVVNLMSSMKQTLKLPLTLNTDIQFLGG